MENEKGKEKNNQPLLCTGTGKSTLVSKICHIHDSTNFVLDCKSFDTPVDFPVPVQSGGKFYHSLIFCEYNFRYLEFEDANCTKLCSCLLYHSLVNLSELFEPRHAKKSIRVILTKMFIFLFSEFTLF